MSVHPTLTTENKWLAARDGLEAPVLDLADGREERTPLRVLVRRTLRALEPHARELGSERELEGIVEILEAATARTPSFASGTRVATSSRSSVSSRAGARPALASPRGAGIGSAHRRKGCPRRDAPETSCRSARPRRLRRVRVNLASQGGTERCDSTGRCPDTGSLSRSVGSTWSAASRTGSSIRWAL